MGLSHHTEYRDSIKHYTNVPRESGKNSYLNLSKASQYLASDKKGCYPYLKSRSRKEKKRNPEVAFREPCVARHRKKISRMSRQIGWREQRRECSPCVNSLWIPYFLGCEGHATHCMQQKRSENAKADSSLRCIDLCDLRRLGQ